MDRHRRPPARYRLGILAAAALFSTGGAAIKACSLSSWQVACFRSGVAAIAVLLILPTARRAWSGRTLAVGCAYAATLILFVRATKLTTAANAIFLQSAAPLYVLVLAPLMLKEKIRPREVAFMSAMGVGLGMVFVGREAAYASAPDPLQGNIMGVLSGLAWALTVMGLRSIARHEEGSGGSAATTAVAAGNSIAFLFCLPMALPLAGAGVMDLAVIGYLGLFQIGAAYALLTFGMRRVPALEASLLLLIEPVLNPVWAWLVQAERPSAWAVAGGAVILAATALRAWLDMALITRSPGSLRPLPPEPTPPDRA